jgi:hypothetical protein
MWTSTKRLILMRVALKPMFQAAKTISSGSDPPRFARGERYALISASPRDAVFGAKHRKQVADWSNSSRVRQKSAELCIGSATLARDALSRGALTAVLWLFKPASPHEVVATPEEGVDWCIAKLRAAGVALPRSAAGLRAAALTHLASI